MTPPLLKMEKIHKWFERVHALKGVDLEANQGEVVALIGDNGAGKSTLMHILVGFIKPSEGNVYIDGKRADVHSPSEARELGIEMVYQDTATISEMSVMENIFLDRELTKSFGPINILDKRKMREETVELTKNLGLNIGTPDQQAKFCSGGERQGIAISRAMYFNAKIVILDEPTAALSLKGTERVIQFIRELKKRGIVVVLVMHDVNLVYDIADRFIVLSLGQKIVDIEKEKTTLEELRKVLISS
jgi:simple sugar transport system ATP-binding protein